MTGSDENIFEKYNKVVEASVGRLTKTRAIELSKGQSQGTISPALIRQLYKSLACDGWAMQVGTNWVWRDNVPKHTEGDSKEVSLERAVAALDVKQWTCQMSTSSGVQGPHRHRRRAIDLVRFIGPGHYAFVELKVESDNPLYAAFEILGYALAYLHARENPWRGTENRDVFQAEKIELTILGPKKWYEIGKSGSGTKFDFKWLADEASSSLNSFVTDVIKGKPTFSMVFRNYSGESESAAQQAKEIHRLAEHDWWKH